MKKVLMLTGIYWSEPIQRHQQFAEYFVNMGYQVTFVEHIVSSRFSFKVNVLDLIDVIRKKRIQTKSYNIIPEGVNLVTSKLLFPGQGIWSLINKFVANKLLRQLDRKYDIIINYLPISTTRYLLQNLSYKTLVYDCVRNFEGWDGRYYKSTVLEEIELVNMSDKIFTDSYFLTHKMQKLTNKPISQFLPIANDNWIKGCTERKKVSKIKNIAYFGSVGNHLDMNIFSLLDNNGINIHIWGGVSDDCAFKYVNHGYQNDLSILAKEIIHYSDAIIIPYKGNMDGVIPAKLTQSLTTKLPVFVCDFYDSRYLQKYIYVYSDGNDLIQQISDFNSGDFDEKLSAIDGFVKNLTEENQFSMIKHELQ